MKGLAVYVSPTLMTNLLLARGLKIPFLCPCISFDFVCGLLMFVIVIICAVCVCVLLLLVCVHDMHL